MNTICRTCGTTLQSGISRDYGQCGACRQSDEYRQAALPVRPDPPPVSSATREGKQP